MRITLFGIFAFLIFACCQAYAEGEAPKSEQKSDKISLPIVKLGGLDKITGRTYDFELAIDETVQFGALQITPKVCYARPSTLKPQTTVFLEIDELTLEKKFRKAFMGWMYADSPGLSTLEHPTYDIWLVGCRGAIVKDEPAAEKNQNESADKPATSKKKSSKKNR